MGYLGQSIQESIEALTGEMEEPYAKMRKQTYQTVLEKLTNGGMDEVQATRIATAAANMAAAMLEAGWRQQAAQIANTAADAYVAALEMGQTEDQAEKAAIWATYEAAMDQAYETYGEDWDAIRTATMAAEKAAYVAFTDAEPTDAQLIYDRAYAATMEVATTVLTTANGPLSSEVMNAVIDLADDFAEECVNNIDDIGSMFTYDTATYDINTGNVTLKLKYFISDLAKEMRLNYPLSSGMTLILALEAYVEKMSLDFLPLFAAFGVRDEARELIQWIYDCRMELADFVENYVP
ncbi:MAG: hypothetical protein LBC04_03245 [Holosporaceae bacterium]|nr:hypothetical protein [Holosporaceae bacterium]